MQSPHLIDARVIRVEFDNWFIPMKMKKVRIK